MNRTRRRTVVFGVLVLLCAAAAAGYVAWAAADDDETPGSGRAGSDAVGLATGGKPFLLFQSVARGPHYAEVALVPLDRPKGPRALTGLVCERVYYAGRRGLCLLPKQGAFGTEISAAVFGTDFRITRKTRLPGISSRARVSPSGRYGSTTTFVVGHSYNQDGFSTQTSLIDMSTGRSLGNIENWKVTKDGKAFSAIDFNFWGVTFRNDERFYATLGTRGDFYLVEGDMGRRSMRVLRGTRFECPSLSPDQTRVAYKKRVGSEWRVSVLDLGTGRETELAEERSVDDQVEWLDDERILYGYNADVWVVQADGGGRPELFLADALSPAVVR